MQYNTAFGSALVLTTFLLASCGGGSSGGTGETPLRADSHGRIFVIEENGSTPALEFLPLYRDNAQDIFDDWYHSAAGLDSVLRTHADMRSLETDTVNGQEVAAFYETAWDCSFYQNDESVDRYFLRFNYSADTPGVGTGERLEWVSYQVTPGSQLQTVSTFNFSYVDGRTLSVDDETWVVGSYSQYVADEEYSQLHGKNLVTYYRQLSVFVNSSETDYNICSLASEGTSGKPKIAVDTIDRDRISGYGS